MPLQIPEPLAAKLKQHLAAQQRTRAAFAVEAMRGILSGPLAVTLTEQAVAERAVKMADCLMARLYPGAKKQPLPSGQPSP